MFADNLSVALLKLCDNNKMSQEKFAAECGISKRYFSMIICRHSVPSIEILERICNNLKVTPNDLLLNDK